MLMKKTTGYVCKEKKVLVGKEMFNAGFGVNQLNYELKQQVSALNRLSKMGEFIFDIKALLNGVHENKGENKNDNDSSISKTIEDEVLAFSSEMVEDFANDAMQAYVDKYYKTSYRYQKSKNKGEGEFTTPPIPSIQVYMGLVSKQIELMENISNKLLDALSMVELTKSKIAEIFEKEAKYQLALLNDKIHQYEINGAIAALKEQGVKYYRIVNEGGQACDDCALLVGKPLEVEQVITPDKLPLFHPNCRCTIGSFAGKIDSGFVKWVKTEWDDLIDKYGLPTGAKWFDLLVSKKRYKKYIAMLQKYLGDQKNITVDGKDYFFDTNNLQNPIYIDDKLINLENTDATDIALLELIRQREKMVQYSSEYNQLILEAYAIMSKNHKTIIVDFFHSLSYYEMGRDVTDELYKMMRDCKEKYKHIASMGESWMKAIPIFNKIVQNGGEMDLKNRPEFQKSGFIFDGEIVDKDALGNITYGFFGKVLSIPDDVLMKAAGWAQKAAGTSKPEFKPTFKDDPRDQLRILQGIEIFNKLNETEE